MDDGDLFPYLHSTPVVPEWPLFAKQDLDREVAEEVSAALVNLHYHNRVGRAMHECKEAANSTAEMDICNTMPPKYFFDGARCDTTRAHAELAYQAGKAGRHSGFRPARSHFELRTIVQDIGFVEQNENGTKKIWIATCCLLLVQLLIICLVSLIQIGDWQCPRVTTLYQAVKCPVGHYKVPEDLFDQQCERMGLPCPAEKGYSCYCKPCIKAFEVDVFEYDSTTETREEAVHSEIQGCNKVSILSFSLNVRRIKWHLILCFHCHRCHCVV